MYEYPLVIALLLLPVAGIFIPEECTLLFAGYLLVQGANPLFLLISAVLGIALSDTLQYVRGRLHSLQYKKFQVGKSFIKTAGFFAVFTGRFFVSSRTILPYMAGALQMKRFLFHTASIVSALLWAAMLIFGGAWLYAVLSNILLDATVIWFVLLLVLAAVLVAKATRSQIQLVKKE